MSAGDNQEDRRFSAALEEFNALRAELVQRIQIQQVLLGLTITSLGALLSVALATKSSHTRLLLVAPFVTSALGFAYSDHSRRINLLGAYIRHELWREVENLSGGRIPSWEATFSRAVHTPFQSFLSSFYIVALFVLAPFATVLYGGFTTAWNFSAGEWTVFSSGLLTTFVYGIYALAVALRHGIPEVTTVGANAARSP
jgi:hypothetical protein